MIRLLRLGTGTGVLCAAALLLAGCCCGPKAKDEAAAVAASTLIEVGRPAPDFTLPTLDGAGFSLSGQRGRIVLVNWFATWCPPCKAELPHLRTRVWERFAGADFALVSVAREEGAEVVAPFAAEYGMDWPVALDVDRAAYARYAEAYIPRNVIVDRRGVVVYQSQGFEEADFAAMIVVLEGLLAAP